MAEIPVDDTGRFDGSTLVWSADDGAYVVGPAAAQSIVGAELADLGEPNYDDAFGVIEGGSGVNKWRECFSWDLARGRWRGATVYDIHKVIDSWALDWTHQPIAAIDNAYARPNGGVGWTRSGACAKLSDDVAVPASPTTFDCPVDDAGVDGLPDSGQLATRGLVWSYASIDRTPGSMVIEDCVLLSGAPVALVAEFTPLIPYAPVLGGGGDPGGYGCIPRAITNAGALWAAGFRPLLQMSGLMNGSMDEKALTLGLFFQQYDYNEDGVYTALTSPPPVGTLGPAITLEGPTDPHAGITDGDGDILSERAFEWGTPVGTGWQTWGAGAITDDIIVPVLYGKMATGAKDTGQAYRVTAELVWEGTP